MSENKTDVHTRLDGIESLLHSIVDALASAAPIVSLIPGAAPIVAGALAVGHVLEEGIDLAEGDFDAAGAAANRTKLETGNPVLDARLYQVESFLEALGPLLAYVARHFGIDVPQSFATIAMPVAAPVVEQEVTA